MPFINGFYAGNASRVGVKSYKVPGTSVVLPVSSDIAPLLIGFAEEFNRKVEPLRKGWCWGYANRNVRNRARVSFHAAGLAIDLNAPRHPLGRRGTFNRRQVATINALCKKYGLRWGGNYRNRKDEMHFEVILPRPQALALVQRLQRNPGKAVAPSTAKYPALGQLKPGGSPAHIKLLQKKIGVKADGIYGPKTRAAVRRVQLRYAELRKDPDGWMGPRTYRRIFGRSA